MSAALAQPITYSLVCSEGMLTHLFFPVRNWSGVWLISNVRRLTLPMVEGYKKGIFQERNMPRTYIDVPNGEHNPS